MTRIRVSALISALFLVLATAGVTPAVAAPAQAPQAVAALPGSNLPLKEGATLPSATAALPSNDTRMAELFNFSVPGAPVATDKFGDNAPAYQPGSDLPARAHSAPFVQTSTGSITIPRPQGAGSASGLDAFYAQKVTWESCSSYLSAEDYTALTRTTRLRATCGYLYVPVDYSNPSGATAALAMVRVTAAGATPTKTLFINPGGPGDSGTSYLATSAGGFASMGLTPDFALVGFDPRGVGISLPAIRCFSPQQVHAQYGAMDILTTADSNTLDTRRGQACRTNSGKGFTGINTTAFLQSTGTRTTARDLDIMRAALGDKTFNYLGYSYGTSIGYAYAEAFPATVGAMVNDSSIDISAAMTNGAAIRSQLLDPGTYPTAVPATTAATAPRAVGTEATFAAFARSCLNKERVALGSSSGCALRDIVAQDQTLAAQLARDTVTDEMISFVHSKLSFVLASAAGTGKLHATQFPARPISSSLVTVGLLVAPLTSTAQWPQLNAALAGLHLPTYPFAEVASYIQSPSGQGPSLATVQSRLQTWAGRADTSLAVALADDYLGCTDNSDCGHSSQALTVISCLDGGFSQNFNVDRCTRMGLPNTFGTAKTLSGLPATLAVGATIDPATDYTYSVLMSHTLGSTLLTVAHSGHTTVGTVSCSSAIAVDYLRNPAAFRANMAAGKYKTSTYTGGAATTRTVRGGQVAGTTCTLYDTPSTTSTPASTPSVDESGDSSTDAGGGAGIFFALLLLLIGAVLKALRII